MVVKLREDCKARVRRLKCRYRIGRVVEEPLPAVGSAAFDTFRLHASNRFFMETQADETTPASPPPRPARVPGLPRWNGPALALLSLLALGALAPGWIALQRYTAERSAWEAEKQSHAAVRAEWQRLETEDAQRLRDVQTLLTTARADASAAEAERDRRRDAVDRLRADEQQLATSGNQQRAERDRLAEGVARLNAESAAALARRDALAAEAQVLEGAVATLTRRRAPLDEALADTKQLLDTTQRLTADERERRVALAAEAEAARKELDALRGDLNAGRTEVAAAERAAAAAVASTDAARQEETRLREALPGLEARQREAASDVATARAELEKLNTEASLLTPQVADARATAETLRTQLAQQDQRLAELREQAKAELAALEGRREVEEQRLAQVLSQSDALRRVEEAGPLLLARRQELSGLTERVTEAAATRAGLLRAIEQLSNVVNASVDAPPAAEEPLP